MKLLVVFALVLASASAGFVTPRVVPVHPRDLPQIVAPEGRITNGAKAVNGQFPHQTALTFSSSSGGWTCGGSVVSATTLLTAMHCIDGASSVTVYYGSVTRNRPALTHTIASGNFVRHSGYNSRTLINDIAIIRTPSISFTSNINKVPLSTTTASLEGQVATASGFGLVSDSSNSISNTLQYTTMNVISNTDCAKVYGSTTINAGTICTKSATSTNVKSTCSGDSGGPLLVNNQLAGVTSFVASSGCESGLPAGFARVSNYVSWIKANSDVV